MKSSITSLAVFALIYSGTQAVQLQSTRHHHHHHHQSLSQLRKDPVAHAGGHFGKYVSSPENLGKAATGTGEVARCAEQHHGNEYLPPVPAAAAFAQKDPVAHAGGHFGKYVSSPEKLGKAATGTGEVARCAEQHHGNEYLPPVPVAAAFAQKEPVTMWKHDGNKYLQPVATSAAFAQFVYLQKEDSEEGKKPEAKEEGKEKKEGGELDKETEKERYDRLQEEYGPFARKIKRDSDLSAQWVFGDNPANMWNTPNGALADKNMDPEPGFAANGKTESENEKLEKERLVKEKVLFREKSGLFNIKHEDKIAEILAGTKKEKSEKKKGGDKEVEKKPESAEAVATGADIRLGFGIVTPEIQNFVKSIPGRSESEYDSAPKEIDNNKEKMAQYANIVEGEDDWDVVNQH